MIFPGDDFAPLYIIPMGLFGPMYDIPMGLFEPKYHIPKASLDQKERTLRSNKLIVFKMIFLGDDIALFQVIPMGYCLCTVGSFLWPGMASS